VFDKRVLRRIFWLKRDKITREWRKQHNEELIEPYFSENIICLNIWRRIRWGHVARMGGDKRWIQV
jgi:hypothetical protein